MWCGPTVHALVFTGALASICASSQQAKAALEIVAQSTHLDTAGQQVDFTLVFNQPPDFQTVDSHGRHADSFQYEIIPNTSQPFSQFPNPTLAVGAVVRGDEIGSGTLLPIRNGIQNGVDPNPASGGWGTVRGSVPFTVSGNQLTFDASYSLLGTTNGVISYDVMSTNYGVQVSNIQGVSVGLPPALPGALCILGGAALVGVARLRSAKCKVQSAK